MKKINAIIVVLLGVLGMNAFGSDGYVAFGTARSFCWDEFTTPGTGVVAPGNVTATFLWAPTGTSNPLGSGVATNGVSSVGSAWLTVSNMVSTGGWTVAVDDSNGSVEADVADNASGIAKGGLAYLDTTTFQLAGTTGGDTYEIIVIGWDNENGESTLEQAMTDGVPMGWSSVFDYATGASVIDPVTDFSHSGAEPFGVAP